MTTQTLEQQLNNLLQAGTAPSTRRAYERDERYFWSWATLRYEINATYPIPLEWIQQFILDHVQGLPAHVEHALLKNKSKSKPGPIKLVTIKRYLATLSAVQQEQGCPSILGHHQVKLLLRRAHIATRTRQQPKQKAAITKAILEQLLTTCDGTLRGIRDRAILLVGFASGGRRRDELVNLSVQDIRRTKNGYLLNIHQSKTDQIGTGHSVPLTGLAAQALAEWLDKAQIKIGRVFRGIRNNNTLNQAMTGRSMSVMIKHRIEKIGLEPELYGAHSLRSGFITESLRQGVNSKDIMSMTGHSNDSMIQNYYRVSKSCENSTATPVTQLI